MWLNLGECQPKHKIIKCTNVELCFDLDIQTKGANEQLPRERVCLLLT